MRLHWLPIGIIGRSTALAGCAPTVWTRPGATFEEANLMLEECADRAERITPASNTHFHGRPTAAAVIGAGLIDAVSDGIRQGAARSDCMTRHGFTPQRANPAPVQIASAPPPAPPPGDPPITPAPSTVSVLARSLPANSIRLEPPQPPTDRRQVVTQDLMRLPDRSRSKAAFLLGACSAGDISACILSDIYNPKRTSLN